MQRLTLYFLALLMLMLGLLNWELVSVRWLALIGSGLIIGASFWRR